MHTSPSRAPPVARLLRLMAMAAALACLSLPSARAADTNAALQLARFNAQAGSPGQAERGRAFFGSPHGGEHSCARCHHQPPTTAGQHASTGKTLPPMAPAFNAQAFTDGSKVDKWFRRNCKDVLARECTATEKADVLAYLISLQR
jgi:hypothetical protein